MQDKPVYVTAEGLAKLEAELEHLRFVRRPEIAQRFNEAKEGSSSSDNADLEDAWNEQATVEGRIQTLERLIRNAEIIHESHGESGVVQIGSRVTVNTQDGDETYTIVGSTETDPRSGRISNESPVGRALLGRKIGDEVEIKAPAGVLSMRITKID